MSKSREYVIAEFLGLNERTQSIVVGQSGARHGSILENIKPVGGVLAKIDGNTLHSTFSYKVAKRPITLIRYTPDNGQNSFIMTTWDNIFRYVASTGVWEPLGKDARGLTLIPRSYPYNTHQLTEANYPYDYVIYDDVLYLTDGMNLPVRVKYPVDSGTAADGQIKAQIGTWGLKPLTGTAEVLSATVQAAAGLIAAGVYRYKVTLYDSVRLQESNISTEYEDVTLLINQKAWVNVDQSHWVDENNYDVENEFIDYIRIYRSDDVGGVGTFTPYRLAATLKCGLITYGTCEVAVGGAVTGVGTNFTRAAVGYVLYGGANAYQITVIADATNCTVVKADGSGVGAGEGVAAGSTCKVLAGFIDNAPNYASATMYFGEATFPGGTEDHSPPPKGKYCVGFGDRNQRLFIAGDPDHPNRLYYSQPLLPNYFPAVNYLDVSPDDGDTITALIKFQARLYVFKHNSVTVCSVEGEPYEWNFASKVLSVGASNNRCIADCGGLLIFANDQGVWSWNGSSLSYISHKDTDSNFTSTWSKVVKPELARSVGSYIPSLHEYWLALCLDDSRGLYDSSLADIGADVWHSPAEFNAGGALSQNNMVACYRIENGQWYFRMNMSPSCLCVWRGIGDSLQVFSGDYGCSVYQQENTGALVVRDGDAGYATAGSVSTLTDTAKAWTTNQWSGATLTIRAGTSTAESATVLSNTATALTIIGKFGTNPASPDAYVINRYDDDRILFGALTADEPGGIPPAVNPYLYDKAFAGNTNAFVGYILVLRPNTATAEYCTVESNTMTTIGGLPAIRFKGEANSFNGVDDGWTVDPANGDTYYLLSPVGTLDKVLPYRWRSLLMAPDSIEKKKRFFDLFYKLVTEDNVQVSYTVDGGGGGSFNIIPATDTDTHWDVDKWDTELTWATEAKLFTMQTDPLEADAEGRYIEIEVTGESREAFELHILDILHKTYTGEIWR